MVSRVARDVRPPEVRIGEIVEVPVYVPSRERLGAVVTVPPDRGASTGVILMTGRARDRAHRNGMWVRAAKALAAQGLYVLRLDYPGVGNSSGPPQVFSLERPPIWAVRDACRFLVSQTPVRRILLVATCFGGRLVLQAAPSIREVAAVAVIASPVYARGATIRSRARNLLRRLLPGGRRQAGGPSNAAAQRREGALASDRRVSPAFAGALRRFLRRGRVYFLYGDGDFVWEELEFALRRLRLPADRYELDLLRGSLHSFLSLDKQQATIDRVVAWCGRASRAGLE